MESILENDVEPQSVAAFSASMPEDVQYESSVLPFIIRRGSSAVSLDEWVSRNRADVDRALHRYGAVLFKGFGIDSAERLNAVALAHSDELLDYIERGAPRIRLGDKVYSSTEYAKEEVIPMHHEMSYSHHWPTTLYFCSEIVAEEGGYTPLADDRKVIRAIPDEIKQRFIDKKVMYVRNYGLGVDMDWREAFQTDSKPVVEEYLAASKTQFEWLPGDVLRTRAVRQAIAVHPVTNDIVWFNHAHLFHSSNMPADVREFLAEEFTEEGMPRNAYYGDGSPIEDSVVAIIRSIYDQHAVRFEWEKGDVLFVDNFLLTHGRSPFKGPRRVCVAMSKLYTNHDI